MKKIFSGVLFFAGVIFILFVVNIVLYSAVPGYKAALSKAVGGDTEGLSKAETDHAGVNVLANGDANMYPDENQADDSSEAFIPSNIGKTGTESEIESGIESGTVTRKYETEKTGTEKTVAEKNGTGEDKKAKQPVIVDKEYHEDCGTGKGYWVITYSDGSTSIE